MAGSHLGDMIRNGVLHTGYLLGPKPTARAVDLSGRYIVVTGASRGSLGYETARTLAAWGANVVVTALDDWRGLEETLREDLRTSGREATRVASQRLDLGDARSVSDFVAWYRDTREHLDVLVNNAGILLDTFARWREPRLSADGFEIHWRVNYLGTFQLTAGLLPLLLESGRRSGAARVVNIVSHQHTRGRNARLFGDPRPSHGTNARGSAATDGGCSMDGRRGWAAGGAVAERKRGSGPAMGRYHSWDAYGQSKLGLIHLSAELQRRYGGGGALNAVAVHPGSVHTNMIARGIAATPGIRHVRGLLAPLSSLVLLKPAQGAQTAIHCASARDIHGGCYYERCAVSRPSADARDASAAARLWEQSQDWVASLPG